MDRQKMLRCALCDAKSCYEEGKDCLGLADRHMELYEQDRIQRLHSAASAIEAGHYCKEPRIREIILFAKEMGFRRIGLAFCIGLTEEARIIEKIFSQHFEVVSVCCKLTGLVKRHLNLKQIHPERDNEVMCNPAGQAEHLNSAGTELNVLCGLCVGHDAIFSLISEAPVTTLIAKDRVLAHNPIGAIYSPYIRRTLL